jgi:hypothetical protein
MIQPTTAAPAASVAEAPPRRPVGWLAALDGPLSGQDFRLYEGMNVIGRDPKQVTVLVGDPTISRVHARIEVSVAPDGQSLKAILHTISVNGCVLDERPVPQNDSSELMDRDRVMMGMSLFVFVGLYGVSARKAAAAALTPPTSAFPLPAGQGAAAPQPPAPQPPPAQSQSPAPTQTTPAVAPVPSAPSAPQPPDPSAVAEIEDLRRRLEQKELAIQVMAEQFTAADQLVRRLERRLRPGA